MMRREWTTKEQAKGFLPDPNNSNVFIGDRPKKPCEYPEYFRPKFEEIFRNILIPGDCPRCEEKICLGIDHCKNIVDDLIECLKNAEWK